MGLQRRMRRPNRDAGAAADAFMAYDPMRRIAYTLMHQGSPAIALSVLVGVVAARRTRRRLRGNAVSESSRSR